MFIQLTLQFVVVISYWNFINAFLLQNGFSKNISDDQEKTQSKWAMGIIPYYFDGKSYDKYIERRLRLAMNQLEEASCVRFNALETKPEPGGSWIHVTNLRKERECPHELQLDEDDPGVILLELGLDCLQQRDILHSLLHAIGFKDEVSHPDRDQYVRVLWENIHPKYRPLFRIQLDEFLTTNHVEYDATSIMHFHDRQFSRNGRAVLVSLLPGLLLYPGDNLSPLDKMKLRLMFGHECDKRKLNALLDSCRLTFQNNTNTKNDKEVTNSEDDKDNNHVISKTEINDDLNEEEYEAEDDDDEVIKNNKEQIHKNDKYLENDSEHNEEDLKESVQIDVVEDNEMDESQSENLDK